MRKNKFFIIVISTLLVIITASAIVLANTENIGARFGSIFKLFKADHKDSENIVFQSDEITITEDEIKYYKEMNRINKLELSDEDIKKNLITNALLLKEAEKAGVSLTDEEVKKYMTQNIEGALKDPENTFNSFLESAGMTKEEYLEKAFPVYKRNFIIGKYKSFCLKPKFNEENRSLNEKERKEQFEEFYKQYKEKLYNDFMEAQQ